jgi:stage V sporulation protein AB
MMVIEAMLLIFIGLSGGFAVGAGLIAFLTVLGIIPRLTQLTKTNDFIHLYQSSIVIGAVFWTWMGLHEVHFHLPINVSIVYGVLAGMFVGMLAAALTEVLNVLPILAKRMNMVDRILWLLMAMVFGKVIGSLFHWVFFYPFE